MDKKNYLGEKVFLLINFHGGKSIPVNGKTKPLHQKDQHQI